MKCIFMNVKTPQKPHTEEISKLFFKQFQFLMHWLTEFNLF